MTITEQQRTFSFVVTLGDLTSSDRDRMYSLLCEHFADVDRDVFEADLLEKDWIIRVDDAHGRIQGFSTLQHMAHESGGERVHAFFSGDTVLARDFMSEASWIGVWTRHAFSQAALLAPEKVYWLLLTATHRTYRILPACFKRFIPDATAPAETALRDLMGALVRQKFPHEYNSESGTVVLSKTIPYRNAEEVEAAGGSHHTANRYFRQVNPGFLRGDFLCCLTEIEPANMTPLGLRILRGTVSREAMTAA